MMAFPANLNMQYQLNPHVTNSAVSCRTLPVEGTHAAHHSVTATPASSFIGRTPSVHGYTQSPQGLYQGVGFVEESNRAFDRNRPSPFPVQHEHFGPRLSSSSSSERHLSPDELPRSDNANNVLCRICQKGPFGRRYELRRHEESVHRPPKYECELCGDRLKRSDDLKRHMRTQHPTQPD
jgi:hypothetical protein